MNCNYCPSDINGNMCIFFAYDKPYCSEHCRRLSTSKMCFENRDRLKSGCYSFAQLLFFSFSSYADLLRKFF